MPNHRTERVESVYCSDMNWTINWLPPVLYDGWAFKANLWQYLEDLSCLQLREHRLRELWKLWERKVATHLKPEKLTKESTLLLVALWFFSIPMFLKRKCKLQRMIILKSEKKYKYHSVLSFSGRISLCQESIVHFNNIFMFTGVVWMRNLPLIVCTNVFKFILVVVAWAGTEY